MQMLIGRMNGPNACRPARTLLWKVALTMKESRFIIHEKQPLASHRSNDNRHGNLQRTRSSSFCWSTLRQLLCAHSCVSSANWGQTRGITMRHEHVMILFVNLHGSCLLCSLISCSLDRAGFRCKIASRHYYSNRLLFVNLIPMFPKRYVWRYRCSPSSISCSRLFPVCSR